MLYRSTQMSELVCYARARSSRALKCRQSTKHLLYVPFSEHATEKRRRFRLPQAHTRRFERFKTLAAKCDPQSDAWQIARTVQQEASNPTGTQNRPDVEGGMSKRALKRVSGVSHCVSRRVSQRYVFSQRS